MPPSWKRGTAAALTLLAVGATFFGFRDLDPQAVHGVLSAVGALALLGLLPQGLGLLIETWGWRDVLRRVGHPVGYVGLLGIRTSTEALGQLLPGGALLAESIKPALLAQHLAVPIPVGIGTTVHRKYLRLLAHAAYVLLAFLLGREALEVLSQKWLGQPGLSWLLVPIGLSLLGVAVGLALLAGQGRVASRLLAAMRSWHLARLSLFLRRQRRAFRATDRASRQFFDLTPAQTGGPIACCTVAWLAEAAESWLLLRLLGVNLPFGWVLAADVVISLSRQILFLLPAGLGLQEAGYLAVLSGLGVADPLTTSAAFSVLKRAKELVWGALGMTWLGWLQQSTKAASPPGFLPSPQAPQQVAAT